MNTIENIINRYPNTDSIGRGQLISDFALTPDLVNDAFEYLNKLAPAIRRGTLDALEKYAIRATIIDSKIYGTNGGQATAMDNVDDTLAQIQIILRIAQIKGEAADQLTKAIAKEVGNLSNEDNGKPFSFKIVNAAIEVCDALPAAEQELRTAHPSCTIRKAQPRKGFGPQ